MKMTIKKGKIFSDKNLPIALHFMAWIIILIIPFYILKIYGDSNQQFLNHLYFNLAIYGALFYVNYLLLIPKLFLKGKKAIYVISTILLAVGVCAGMWYVNEYLIFDKEKAKVLSQLLDQLGDRKEEFRPPIKEFGMLNFFYTTFLILGFSLGLKLLGKVKEDEKIRKELEKEKLNSELAFLKNQISPHFFFNTLNNIYSQISIDAQSAQQSVLNLSKLMRYLLYESEIGESKLSQEIAFLENYIDLMKLRLNKKVSLSVSFPTSYPDHDVPPLLFVPFIENAFKHGVSYRSPSFIEVRMDVTENKILFFTRNSIGKSNHPGIEQHHGIGLENVKKRLNLLFPENHILKIDENNDVFSVDLILNIKPENEQN